MTNHNFLKKLKYCFVAFLALLFLFCAQAFCLTACATNDNTVAEDTTNQESSTEEDTTEDQPSYSYKDPEDGEIANAFFTKGTAGKKLDEYPLSSSTDWTRSSDNGAISSNVNSGVVDLSSDVWKETSAKLKDDTDLIKVLSYKKYGNNSADNLTLIKDNFDTEFKNPGLYDSQAKDSKVYMLNNYSSSDKYVGSGTAQYIQNSSKINLEKGKTAKITVWVYTMNLNGNGNPDYVGANIVISNKINGIDQNNYKISSIDTNETWKKFEIYVSADKNYSSTISIKLGLGYGGGKSTAKTYYTEGTVFFDDLSYELVDAPALDAQFTTKLDFNKVPSDFEKNYRLNPSTSYHYDMNINDFGNNTLSASSFTNTEDNTNEFFTLSNIEGQSGKISTKNIFGAENSKIEKNGNEFTLTNASASIKLSSNDWKLSGKKYAFVSFTIKNELTMLGASNISVDVYDVYTGATTKQTTALSIEKSSKDATICNLLIQNNFSSADLREFYIVVKIGPTDLNEIDNIADVASGKVTISNVNYFINDIPADDIDDKNYAFMSSTASKSIALYAGQQQDASEDTETTDSYTLNTKPSEIGFIITGPAKVKDYFGVEANHSYISNESDIYALDTRTNDGDANGNYAGLINTKYVNNYSLTNIPFGTITEDIQPLMIYNNVADSYGYIGKTFTIDSNDYSKISMKVRVVDDAVAYIYLIDVSKTSKDVLTFNDFSSNATIDNKGSASSASKLMLKIDSSILESQNKEWVDVEFYIATGASSKQVRLEVWNGSRDGSQKSQGYVFFNDIKQETPSNFDGSNWEGAFEDITHPLFDVVTSLSTSEVKSLISYKRPLTDIEKQFNEEYKGQKEYVDYIVEYKENYIWAETSTMIYAVYNTIDPDEIDPYTLIPSEEEEVVTEEEGSGCAAKNDPSSFWLSFSSIALGVILVLAIIALFIKNYTRKHRIGPDDNKSHYNVSSRIRSQKEINRKKAEEKQKALEEEQNSMIDTPIEENLEENIENTDETTIEQEIDDYVYGEVIEDFTTQENQGEQSENNESSSDDQE